MSSQLDQIDSSQATQQYEEKQWVLKDGIQMKVGNYYKKTTEDKFRTLDLVFRFEGDPNPKIVGKLTLFFPFGYNFDIEWVVSITIIHFQ